MRTAPLAPPSAALRAAPQRGRRGARRYAVVVVNAVLEGDRNTYSPRLQ